LDVGKREVRWARWYIMWKSSRNSGMAARKMAVNTMPMMLSVVFPSSILAKRLRLRRKERPKRVPSKMRRWGGLSLMRSLAVRVVVEIGAIMILTAIMMRRKAQMEN